MTAPPRVRHLLKGLGPGGAERLVVAQATAPGSFHHEVAYLLAHKHHLVSLLEVAGIAVVCLDARGLARPGWIIRLRRLLRESPTEVLHVHSPAVAAVARVLVLTLPSRVRPAVVGTEHNRWPRHRLATRLANRLTIRLEQATVAVSADVKSTVRGISPARVRVITHGIDLASVRATAQRGDVRDELAVDEHDFVVMCVANLRREKSLDVLIEAARIALAVAPGLRYFLIGQGPLAEDVADWIDRAGVGARFTALGYREDARRLMSGADAFTLSSAHEGLPVAIMEALALGLPIIATAAGGVPDAAGRAGLISPIGDAAALGANHVIAATDPVTRGRLCAAAPIEAERFSITRSAAEIEQVYAGAISSTGRRSNNHS